MFYTNSYGYRVKNWIETDETDPVKVIEKFYYDNCFIYDADICGDRSVEFAFEIDGKIEYYKLDYSWYIDYDPEWEIHNEFTIEKIEKPKTRFPANRDWLILSKVFLPSLPD